MVAGDSWEYPVTVKRLSFLMLSLSVLDLISVRTNQTSSDAIAASVALAQRADTLGFTRYWVAEHHNMPAVASTVPAVLIAHLAASTERIRLGSGGVMLPNHAPLSIAEQFALLEAMHPGRIDLGIGRAPGSDPITGYLVRGPRAGSDINDHSHVDSFPTDVQTVAALLGADEAPRADPFDDASQPGVVVPLRGSDYEVHATPRTASSPHLWLLGSSEYSARLAASTGTRYVYAHHFGAPGIDNALAIYRSSFVPTPALAEPATFLTVNAVLAETKEQAWSLALPQLITMARLRAGGRLGPQLTIEQAAAEKLSATEADLVDDQARRWIIGTVDTAETELAALATKYNVAEVMVSPGASASDSDDPRRSPAKERTLELLAEAAARLS